MAEQEQVAVVDEVPAEVVADQTLPDGEAQPAEEKPAQPAETEEKKNHNWRRLEKDRIKHKVRAEMLAEEVASLRRMLEGKQAQNGSTAQPADATPTREMFSDDASYMAAATAYEVARQLPAAVQQALPNTSQQESDSNWSKREAELEEQNPDYEDAMDAFRDVPVLSTQHAERFKRLIGTSEHGPDLVYHFGKNPEEARQIAAMPPEDAARRIGQIEAKIAAQRAAKPVAKPSAAPAPVRPVGVGGASAGTPLDKIDNLAEYQARRREQLIPRKT